MTMVTILYENSNTMVNVALWYKIGYHNDGGWCMLLLQEMECDTTWQWRWWYMFLVSLPMHTIVLRYCIRVITRSIQKYHMVPYNFFVHYTHITVYLFSSIFIMEIFDNVIFRHYMVLYYITYIFICTLRLIKVFYTI